ncbi:hypothetical protein R3P38DRAFT_2787482 [Favolaschia claudopus]|uniref:Uncharacterized protein n=1 Tax=Favolaschia claudopus TaxID=2862362 RepID=A0AAW0ARC7_9AGAR
MPRHIQACNGTTSTTNAAIPLTTTQSKTAAASYPKQPRQIKIRRTNPAELADQVDISLKDAVAAFRISKEQYHVHPTPSQKTRELAAEVYRLTHGGDTWMENMVESAVEAARCATRDYDDLKGMVTGLIEQIKHSSID